MDSEHLANYLEKILIQSWMNESKENFKVSNIFREESMLAIATEKDGAEDEFYIFVVRNKRFNNSMNG